MAITTPQLVELGTAMLDFVPGPMFTFIDPRLYDNTAAMVRQAKSLVGRFEKFGVPRDRVVITIPATEQGIHAARDLVNNSSIYVNLTLVSGIVHSSACVEAGATVMTMSMSPLLEWFERKRKTLGPATPHHPGVETLQTCISYLHLHDVKTKVVIADVRLLTELRQIHGLDAVLLSKGQLGRIRGRQVTTRIPDVTDKTPASLRASQAQYPTTFLQSKKGLMFTMSAETRSMVSAVLYVGIGKMKACMEKIESTIRDELRWQIELDNLDLRKIYFREPETPQRKQVKHRESPKAADRGAHNWPATSVKPSRNSGKLMIESDECF
ncbi:hypothetical protein SERLA73DRAFT_105896 [Serpula lacrymans var. lacrymans S7.3]|uniref:Uncharacterized protein n=1 Tax=Serpula lacrymans var. lacrymans (strain S7.3) TaxID=936435 RepID=F8PS80_SERL3|nr:hypothetical protein SERLA73DRAFT_105896 [Serpula lacrymans var. lacrymans S7.3]